MTQFSLFGAAAADPVLADLDGVLLAGGWLVRLGAEVRLSIVVADRWRAEALAAEFAARGLTEADIDADAKTNPNPAPVVPAEGGWNARTPPTAALADLAATWTRGARQEPPAGLVLTAAGLRLWAIAAGRRLPTGYQLGTAEPDDATHRVAGACLARLGVAAVAVSGRIDPGWRVTSAKRLRRLHELVGPAPEGAGTDWPQVS